MNSRFATVALSFVVFFNFIEKSFGCPSGQYSWMGMCMPEIGGTPGSLFEKGKKELEGVLGGVPLEQWIINSRYTMLNGAMPIPPQIRQALTGYASEDSMNRVRYKIGDNGVLNLARLLEQAGFADAVTLIDVVVFRGPGPASDPAKWAHELVHVDQYAQWGTHSFAAQYAKDYNSVEAPAYAKGNGYWAWAQANGVTSDGGFAPPAQAGSFCYTPFGKFGPGPVQPIGAPCSVPVQGGGWVNGQVGP